MAPTPTPTPAPAGISNPIEGLTPDGSIFGQAFTDWWHRLFQGGWLLLLVGCIVALAIAFATLHKATSNNVPGQADGAKERAKWAVIATVGVAAIVVITDAIFAAAG
jgi:hypothetical protein